MIKQGVITTILNTILAIAARVCWLRTKILAFFHHILVVSIESLWRDTPAMSSAGLDEQSVLAVVGW
jgi:hypothetical protein